MNDDIPAVMVVQDMFETVSMLYESGALNAPDGVALDEYLTRYRQALHAKLFKQPPMKRFDSPEHIKTTFRLMGFPKCAFVFFGEVHGLWVYLGTKFSPLSADADDLFENKEILLAPDGWFYNIRYPGIRLGIYQSP